MSAGFADAQAEGIVGLLLRLRERGITDQTFLKLIESIPRERFVQADYQDLAWRNEFLPLACGQTMLPPDLTVTMIQAMAIESSHSVLEIGTGSGYQTALLSKLARKVLTVDRYQTLLESAKKRLAELNLSNVTFQHYDGHKAVEGAGLFDRIIVDSAFPGMPREFIEMLVAGGRLITAIGNEGEEQMLVRLTKIGSRFERTDLFPVRFGMLQTGLSEAL